MNTNKNTGHTIYFGDDWHYTMEHVGRWKDGPTDSLWWESRMTLHSHPVPESSSVSAEVLNSILALASSGRTGIRFDPILCAWAYVHELRLDGHSQGGIPHMRLDDHRLSIAFAEPERQTTADIVTLPRRQRRRVAT